MHSKFLDVDSMVTVGMMRLFIMQNRPVRNMRHECRILHGMHKNGRKCNAGQVDPFQDEDYMNQ
jgi:hypothetical protein